MSQKTTESAIEISLIRPSLFALSMAMCGSENVLSFGMSSNAKSEPTSGMAAKVGSTDGLCIGAWKPAPLLLTGPTCCEEGCRLGVEICDECSEISAGYQAAMGPE